MACSLMEARALYAMVSWQWKSCKVDKYRPEIREATKEIERIVRAFLQKGSKGANSNYFEGAVELLMDVGKLYLDMEHGTSKGEELLWTCVDVATKEWPLSDLRLKGLFF